MSAGWVRKDFPKPYQNGGLRMQNEEGGGAALGGEMPWNAGDARLACCDDDDDDC